MTNAGCNGVKTKVFLRKLQIIPNQLSWGASFLPIPTPWVHIIKAECRASELLSVKTPKNGTNCGHCLEVFEMIQFIHYSDSGSIPSSSSTRTAHSHAARTAHARARQLRIIQYQSTSTTQQPTNDSAAGSAQTHAESSAAPSDTRGFRQRQSPQISSPASILSSDRKDPFATFAWRLRPIEHFLFDHCQYSPALE